MHNKQFGQCEAQLSTDYKEPQVLCYENHANDSRITESNDVSPLISSRAGTGGGNLPSVQECFAIDSMGSNAMKSSNPYSGFHKEEVAKTLDTTDPNPTKNQGGNVIVSYDCYNQADCGDIARTLSTEHHGTNLNVIASSINCQGGSNINVNNDITETLTAATNTHGNEIVDAVAIAENIIGRAVHNGGNGVGAQEEVAYTQNATGVMGVCQSTVRRLLPIECERLMGFPDNWTRIPWKGKLEEECPDSPRYKACGNSFCVNVVQWIGEQIDKVEKRK
jgi:hypothetical protein